MARVICVANQKGGVGKTTTSINLAASLSVLEHKTLLIDCDPQANSSSGLGYEVDQGKPDLYSVFCNPEYDAITGAIIHPKPFLDVLPASINLVGIEVELASEMARERYLSNIIQQIEKDYDFIIIDCPPSLSLLTLNALCASTELLIPLQCEFFALEGIVKLMNTYHKVRRVLNPNLRILGILLTMYDSRNRLSKEVQGEITKVLPQYLLNTYIPRNVRLSEAPSHGRSIIHYDVKSKGAIAYIALAEEILTRKPTP